MKFLIQLVLFLVNCVRYMANRYTKRCSTSLIIREVKIKTIKKYHLIPVKLAMRKQSKSRK